ncbi:MAG: RNA polymerase sigma factor [Lachnospiraceae bacterium]|nr:RNA polymerase sigma factor [Lachnospiraceae bacterium]
MTIEEIVLTHSDMLYRICMVMLGNEADAQDAVQDTFCRYLEQNKRFADKEHEKAWLIRVATNRCRDMQRLRLRHPKVELEKITASYEAPDYNEVIAELIKLPPSIKSAVYLHYIEGYKLTEVSEMLGISSNAVKKRLQRGRKMLKLRLEDSQQS